MNIWGKIEYNGKYFSQFKNINDAFFVLNENKFIIENQNLDVLNFLTDVKYNKKQKRKTLLKDIKSNKEDIKKINNEIKFNENKNGFLETVYLDKIKKYDNFKVKNNNFLKTQIDLYEQKQKLLKDNRRIEGQKDDLHSVLKKTKTL